MGFAWFDTEIGRCGIGWSEQGIDGVWLPGPCARQVEGTPTATVRAAIDRIRALLTGVADDLTDIELDLSGASEFHRRVYAIARKVPPGKTTTYGEIALQLGDLGLSRAIGQAMGDNPCPIIVPCHRVLAADGKPGGFSAPGGVRTKMRMLAIEGAATPSLFDV